MYEIGLGIILTLFALTVIVTLTVGEPPTPPNARSFGNERPPLDERKPPKTDPAQSTQDLLWLWIYTQNMESDAMLEENVDEFKRGYVEAMEDVRQGIEFIDKFNN